MLSTTMEQKSDHANADTSPESATSQPQAATGPEALNDAVRRVAEAREDLVYLAAVEIDRWKLKMRRMIIWAAVGIAALIVFVAILISATALLLWGLADLIGKAFGDRTWVGALVVGGGILLLASGSMYGGIWSWNRSAFKAVKRRYELHKRSQRERFGHSVDPRDDRFA
jgi:hypothetical protein